MTARWLSTIRSDPLYACVVAALDLFVRLTCRLTIQGTQHLPAEGAAIVVANHVSYLDPVVIGVVVHRLGRRPRFVAVAELFEKPVLGALLRRIGQIPLTSPRGALVEAGRALDNGDLVLIYPEGTIPRDSPVRPRRGAVVLAVTRHVVVVPIATRGLERRRGRRWRRDAVVGIGPPLDLTKHSGQTAQDLDSAARSLLDSIYRLKESL
jgi:1-acyl-sn-glycerol-3-phosphate acyltransferase